MSKRVRHKKKLRRASDVVKCISITTLLVIGAASLGGCGASSLSNNFAPTASNSDPPAYASTGAGGDRAALSHAADELTSVATPGNSAYKIGPMDVLDVSVFNVPDLAKTVQVAGDGTINYPLVGEVPAAGKTAAQLENDLAKKLGDKYLRSPQVTVFVKDYNSQRVTVEGSVKTSGVYAIKGKTSLAQILAMAGGVDDNVASGDVVIFRTINGTRSAAKFDIDAILHGRADDPELEPGDVIVADSSTTKVALHNILGVLPLATSAAVFVPMM
jgi:polysaccharide biosynthesis/export protein